MSFSAELLSLKKEVLEEISPMFKRVEEITEANTLKILDAMREAHLSEAHFNK